MLEAMSQPCCDHSRPYTRTPNCAPDGTSPPGQTRLGTVVDCHLLAWRCSDRGPHLSPLADSHADPFDSARRHRDPKAAPIGTGVARAAAIIAEPALPASPLAVSE